MGCCVARHTFPWRVIRTVAWGLFLPGSLLFLSCSTQSCLPARGGDHRFFSSLLVEPDDPVLLCIAAPVAATVRRERPPFLFMVPQANDTLGKRLIRAVPAGQTALFSVMPRPAFLAATHELGIARARHFFYQNLFQAARRTARHFWDCSELLVVASIDDPSALVYGAALAAHRGVPFIPLKRGGDLAPLHSVIKDMRVKTVWAVSTRSQYPNVSANLSLVPVDPEKALALQVDSLQAETISNIVVTFYGDDGGMRNDQSSFWLAPYLAMVRRSPVIVLRDGGARATEKQVWQVIRRFGLRPRTITILAGYDEVGTHTFRIPSLEDEGMEVEPFSLPRLGDALSFGVGRLPYPVGIASRVICAGLLKERESIERPVLLTANPPTDFSALPLAETVSRLTAAELKNTDVPVAMFFGVPTDRQAVRRAAETAGLIIYEGHSFDQRLFELDEPVFDGTWDVVEPFININDDPVTTDTAAGLLTLSHVSSDTSTVQETTCATNNTQKKTLSQPLPPLSGLPLVILQSCSSLEDEVNQQILRRGGLGLIGSVTSIHSASGSSFIHALVSGAAYHRYTVGSALLHAKNYYLSLQQLKTARGHKQQAKGLRVALSFRLWGDPQWPLFPFRTEAPLKPPVRAVWTARTGKVRLALPRRTLRPIRTKSYLLRSYPGCQVAGIVKRLKNSSRRKIMPLCFHRLPLPRSWAGRAPNVSYRDRRGPRAVTLYDPLSRWVYLLVLPKTGPRQRYIDIPVNMSKKTAVPRTKERRGKPR